MAQDQVLVHPGNRSVKPVPEISQREHFVGVSQYTGRIIVRSNVDFDPDPYRTHRLWHSRLTEGPDGTGGLATDAAIGGRSAGGPQTSNDPVRRWNLELLDGAWSFVTPPAAPQARRLLLTSQAPARMAWRAGTSSAPNPSAEAGGIWRFLSGPATGQLHPGFGARMTITATTRTAGFGFLIVNAFQNALAVTPAGDLQLLTRDFSDDVVVLWSTFVGFPAVLEVRNEHEIYVNGALAYNSVNRISHWNIFSGFDDGSLPVGNQSTEFEDIEFYQTHRAAFPTAPPAKTTPWFEGNADDKPVPNTVDVDLGWTVEELDIIPSTNTGIIYPEWVAAANSGPNAVDTGVIEPNRQKPWELTGLDLIAFHRANTPPNAQDLFVLDDRPRRMVVRASFSVGAGNGFSFFGGGVAHWVVMDDLGVPANNIPPWTGTLWRKSLDINNGTNMVTMNFPTTDPTITAAWP